MTRKNKLYHVTFTPDNRMVPYDKRFSIRQIDKDVNKVKHTKRSASHFYGESATVYDETYSIPVYASSEEEGKLKAEELIKIYIEENK